MIEFMTENARNSEAVNEWLTKNRKLIENKNLEILSIVNNPEFGISTTAKFIIFYVKRDNVRAVAR